MRMIPLLAGIALLLAQCVPGVRSSLTPSAAPVSELTTAAPVFSVADLLKNQTHRRQIIVVERDPFFKTAKRYSAVPLRPWLDSVLVRTRFDTTNAIVVFECGDGYKPTMLLSEVLGAQDAYVAFADADAPPGQTWSEKAVGQFGLAYLVWPNTAPGDPVHYAWPYGLTNIRLMPVAREFKTVFPADNVGLQRGFHLFRENCMKCHAVNRVGGDMGPEMNVPKNITEYWREEDIMAFAQNPPAYRANSKMPPVTHLNEAELREIVQYLRYMANRKISDEGGTR